MASPGISCASRSKWPPCLHPHLLPRTWRSGMLCLCSPQDVGCARAAPAPCAAANCREVWMNYSFRLLCRLGAYLGCSLFGRELEMVGETERDSIAGCCPSWSTASASLHKREPESTAPRWALTPKPTQNRGKSTAPGLTLSFKTVSSVSVLPPSNAC